MALPDWMKNKKWYERITGLIPTNTVTISIIVFIIAVIIVKSISLICYDYWDPEFWKNVRVEAHGMLFDILVIGVFILFLNKLAEKRIENQRYLDEIDDFRGWKSDEAAFRIAGNIKRLNRNRYKSKINLVTCCLSSVDLYGENLRGANLTNATLRDADLTKTDLSGAILRSANLSGAKLAAADLTKIDLTKANLSEAFLRGANLTDADLQVAKLQGSNLQSANLFGANLQGADLQFAILEHSNLQSANLKNAKNLTLEQLANVKTLYKAKLDLELLEQIKEKYPHLLEKPK